MSLTYYFDIGNTRAKLWCCVDGVPVDQAVVAHAGRVGDIPGLLPPRFDAPPAAILGATVMDDAAVAAFIAACTAKWHQTPRFAVSSSTCAGVISAYEEAPETLGVDRWLALIAVAGMGQDVCVVDCGTAVTLDVLQADGQHLGGYILPGLSMMAEMLLKSTRRVRFDPAQSGFSLAPGRSTGEAVTHGALAAVVALIEKEAGVPGRHIVLAGGDADRISALLACPHHCEPDLLLKGLQRYFSDAGIN